MDKLKIGIIKDYVLFDIETTGLSPDTDAIIELSAIKVVNHEVADEFSTLINPGIHIPYYARDFKSFAGTNVLAGHNIVRFDLKFIQRDSALYTGRPIQNDYLDTLFIARHYLPELESHSLESLSDYYGISYNGAHRALADCYINKQVYDCLIKEIENPSDAAKKVKVCPRCGNIMKKRNGIYGEFWGCASYPDCKYTQDC